MAVTRKALQGVGNIVRFNWHFYVLAAIAIVALLLLARLLPTPYRTISFIVAALAVVNIGISLLASFYIYDYSPLYQLRWLPNLNNKKVLNINAGFDETSAIISNQYHHTHLTIADFYNPVTHTEISIKRARKAYPPQADTLSINTANLPFANNEFDYILAILSAHEIRLPEERISFFNELNRALKPDGRILVTEHLRDRNNFLVYTFGFFHFHARKAWHKTFSAANLQVQQQIKTTPFITTFVLTKNGTTT